MPEKVTGVNVGTVNAGEAACLPRGGGAVVIYATFPSLAVGEAIGGQLVEAGLAACVNLLPGLRSIYRWQGAVHRDDEVAGLVKTQALLTERVIAWVRVAHPYANPAIVVLPAIGGSAEFLGWIAGETSRALG